jgi:hypothetical protein
MVSGNRGFSGFNANQAVGIRIETVERGLPAHRRRAARQRQADEGHQTESSERT